MAAKSTTPAPAVDTETEGFEFVTEIPSNVGISKGHTANYADKVCAAIVAHTANGEAAPIVKVTVPEDGDVEKMRRDFRYAAYRLDMSATTRESNGFVYVTLVTRRRTK
jgi:hypothetical protein